MSQYFDKQIKNTQVIRRDGKNQTVLVILALALGCVITYGFILAAQKHFSALEIGYKSEELKRERDKLELQQRKLTLEMERKLAPQKLDSKAQQQGLALPVAKVDKKQESEKVSD